MCIRDSSSTCVKQGEIRDFQKHDLFSECHPKVERPESEDQSERRNSTPVPIPLRMSGRHFPEYIPATNRKMNPTKQCGVCRRVRDCNGKKIRRESRYYCPDCNVSLCVSPCFRVYHTVENI